VFPEVTPEAIAHQQHMKAYHERIERLLRTGEEFCPDGANDLDYIDDNNSGREDDRRTDVYCPYMETLLIEHSGDINPCCTYWNEYTLRMPQRFGNANKQTLTAIWNSRTYTSFRRRVIEGAWPVICQNCNARLPRSR
jgi:radical SAM protein with 4Fe4S-binding SPASM domain